MKNSEYLHLYSVDGESITDPEARLFTGAELRLMNGPDIKDRVMLIVRGDVNGDGAADMEDAKRILCHVSREKPLDGCNEKAADLDGDGKITVSDVVGNTKISGFGKTEFSVIGPDEFASNDEIKVSLYADIAGIQAISGAVDFAREALSVVGVESDLPGWLVSQTNSGSRLIFSAALIGDGRTAEKGNKLITVTFRVGNITSYSDATVIFSELTAFADGKTLTAERLVWDNSVMPTYETQTTEVESFTGKTETVQVEMEAKNKLALLKLEEAEISPTFDPDVKEYTAEVPFEVEKVTVTAIAADETSTVSIGDTNLEYVGKNLVTVTVLSEEGLKRTYKIMVKRNAPVKSVSKKTDGLPLWVILLICCGVVAVSGVVFLLVYKKRKKQK